MLISEETEQKIEAVIAALASSISVFMIGRELGQTSAQALSSALTTRKLTFLEQSYLSGKIASRIGVENLRKMTESEIRDWIINNNVTLSDLERADLEELRRNTRRWLDNRSSTWAQKAKIKIASADQQWRAAIASGNIKEASARSLARNTAFRELTASIRGEAETFKSDVDRLIQTEMHAYFQRGRVSEWSGEEIVYKIPRSTACRHCMRLHVESDGSPKKYLLSDVVGNSNWGLPAYSWQFTIGPVHPHCYCELYREVERKPRKSKRLAQARSERLSKSAPEDHNSCGVEGNPVYEEMIKSAKADEEMPDYVAPLIELVAELNSDKEG